MQIYNSKNIRKNYMELSEMFLVLVNDDPAMWFIYLLPYFIFVQANIEIIFRFHICSTWHILESLLK